MFHELDSQMNNCIQSCGDCANECKEVLFQHCLSKGGAHIEQAHVNLMVDCIQICRMSADFMLRGSDMHMLSCALCAEICDACAVSCDDIGDAEMEECAELCRRCAESCREMSGNIHLPHESAMIHSQATRPYM